MAIGFGEIVTRNQNTAMKNVTNYWLAIKDKKYIEEKSENIHH